MVKVQIVVLHLVASSLGLFISETEGAHPYALTNCFCRQIKISKVIEPEL